MGILETRVRPLSEQDKYRRKLDIIQKNLYGVDLQGFAIETARLRLWLSLVVEDERHPLDDPDDCDVALPNLDFKIERGDRGGAPSRAACNSRCMARPMPKTPKAWARLEAEFFAPNRDGQGRRKDTVKAGHRCETDGHQASGSAAILCRAFWTGAWPSRKCLPRRDNRGFGRRAEPGRDTGKASPRSAASTSFSPIPPYGALSARKCATCILTANCPPKKASPKTPTAFLSPAPCSFSVPAVSSPTSCPIPGGGLKSHKPLRRRLAETTSVGHVLGLPAWVFDGPTVNTCILTFSAAPPPAAHTLIAGDLRSIQKDDWRTLEENLRFAAAQGWICRRRAMRGIPTSKA